MTDGCDTHVRDASEGQPAEAAKQLGVTQPRGSDLLRGKMNLFGFDAPVSMAAAVGLRVDLQVHESA
nr:XRE family transcriptional regulator [Burkholderia diffusa]